MKPHAFIFFICRCVLLSASLFAFAGCPGSRELAAPDVDYFNRVVASPALRDSLRNNALTAGMPIVVAEQVFRHCKVDTLVAVASVGSRQPLREREGLYSQFHDPNIEVYLNTYQTPKGKLYVWYRDPDFYRLNVMGKDSIYLYWNGQSARARIEYLLKPTLLMLDQPISTNAITTAEIRSREQPGKVTYWYNLSVLAGNAIRLEAQQKDLYPIMHLELENNPVPSFRWR